ncbi:MAG: hypothetical protein ACJ8GN_08225 [Longimicrobiaceae bacterium]
MTRHWLTSALSVALSLAAGLATPAAAQGPDTAGTRISFQAPPAVGEFRLIGHEVLEQAGAGAHLRYERPGQPAWIDVYVYPVPDSGCTAGCDSLAVRRESDDFAGMIPELVRRGYYDSLRVASDQRLSLGAGARPMYARHLVLRGGREGRAVASQFYLVAGGEVLVKVRATYPPDPSMDGELEAFARGFVEAALGTVTACAGGPPQGEGISITAELPLPLDSVRARMKPALERLGYTVQTGTPADTWVTQPMRGWPARELWDMMKAVPPLGLQVRVEARAEGGKSNLAISARATCGSPQDRQMETTAALIAAMEVMAEFPDAQKK